MNKGQKLTFTMNKINLWSNSLSTPSLLFLLLLGFVFSCGTSKKLEKDSNLSSTELLVRRLEPNKSKPKPLMAGPKSISAVPICRPRPRSGFACKKTVLFGLPLSKLGFEVGRALITSDSVHILDRINNEYAVYALDYLSKAN